MNITYRYSSQNSSLLSQVVVMLIMIKNVIIINHVIMINAVIIYCTTL